MTIRCLPLLFLLMIATRNEARPNGKWPSGLYSFRQVTGKWRGEWPSGLYSLRQVTEVKLGRVRSDFGWVTT